MNDKIPRTILSREEVEKLVSIPNLDTPMGKRDRAVLELLYSTGMRRLELIQLKLHDIDYRKGTVFIHGKGGKERVVPVGDRALGYVQLYLQETRPLYARLPEHRFVFITEQGEPLIHSRLSALVKRLLKRAGLEYEGSAHLLRHAMATHMLEAGAELRFIQEMLGHSKPETTGIYTRVAIGKLKEIHERFHG